MVVTNKDASFIAQCLYVLTDANEPAVKALRTDLGALKSSLDIVQDTTPADVDLTELRVLTCGMNNLAVLSRIY